MVITDTFVYRTARLYLALHGDEAMGKARERVADLKRRGDGPGAEAWLRVVAAIEELQSPNDDHTAT